MSKLKFDFTIRSKGDLMDAVETYGFVPLFANSIPGFSIEEHVAEEVWFNNDAEGVWEWKGPVIRETGCAYGKFFEHKAAFISREWFPDFANCRRDGYDFDARFDDGLAPFQDKLLYELVADNGPILSKGLKALGNYRKGGRKGFDTSMNRLQAQCYVLVSDFQYLTDKFGKPYGWGVAEYATPELWLGEDFSGRVYGKDPEESYALLYEHFQKLLPHAYEDEIEDILG